MFEYYIYLISSLPMLHFAMKPPFSFERFLLICQEKIAESDVALLRTVSLSGEYLYEEALKPTLKRWYAFDTALRNELVRIRAARKRDDPLKYIRPHEHAEPSIAHIAINAYRNPLLLEAERTLDQYRWRKLSQLIEGHYFDIDLLIVYALKLLILQRWENIRSQDPSQALESVLAKT